MIGDWPEHHCVIEHQADGSWFVWYGHHIGLIVPDRAIALAAVPAGFSVEITEPPDGPNAGWLV
jgi:hypothetical protein